jgi:hypothetical protein
MSKNSMNFENKKTKTKKLKASPHSAIIHLWKRLVLEKCIAT